MNALLKFLRDSVLFETLPTRKRYFLMGCAWMLVKYLGDVLIFWLFEGRVLLPHEFLNPFLSQRWHLSSSNIPPLYYLAHVVWTLPFIWIGFSLSVRRCIDAGFQIGTAFLFFIPFLNYLMMIFLSSIPSDTSRSWVRAERDKKSIMLKEAIGTMILGALFSTGIMAILIYVFKEYSAALFLGVPFIYGFVVTTILNLKERRALGPSIAVTIMSQSIAAGLLILFAMEGAICIAMAIPIFLVMSLCGTIAADVLADAWTPRKPPSATAVYSLFLLPLVLQPVTKLAPADDSSTVREVLTVIEIAAPPEKVWPSVVQFSELPPPDEWIFKMGVAHPLRARIEGHGVGAIRRCQFSTGDFVEPITTWNEPSELSFSVAFQPRPMDELSIYDKVYAPHLDGFIQSQRGQFKLIRLENGGTRLEGRTWFTINIHPASYWAIFADELIHRIHQRVLRHIRSEVETLARQESTSDTRQVAKFR